MVFLESGDNVHFPEFNLVVDGDLVVLLETFAEDISYSDDEVHFANFDLVMDEYLVVFLESFAKDISNSDD